MSVLVRCSGGVRPTCATWGCAVPGGVFIAQAGFVLPVGRVRVAPRGCVCTNGRMCSFTVEGLLLSGRLVLPRPRDACAGVRSVVFLFVGDLLGRSCCIVLLLSGGLVCGLLRDAFFICCRVCRGRFLYLFCSVRRSCDWDGWCGRFGGAPPGCGCHPVGSHMGREQRVCCTVVERRRVEFGVLRAGGETRMVHSFWRWRTLKSPFW